LATLKIALALIPLMALTLVWGGVLRGLGFVVAGQVPYMILCPTVLIFLIGCWVGVTGGAIAAPAAIGLYVAALGVALTALSWMLWRWALPYFRDTPADYSWVPDWWRAAIPFVFVGGLHFINVQTDILMLGMLQSDRDVGLYRVSVQMSTLIVFGLQAANQVVAPQVGRLAEQKDYRRMQALATGAARAVSCLAIIPAMLFIAFGAPLLAVVFGAAYESSATPLAILAIGQLLNALTGSGSVFLNMTGHEHDTMLITGSAAVSNVVLNLMLIPLYAGVGAAVATTTTLGISNVLLALTVYRRIGVISSVFSFGKH
jgi:O-antigen/teichoic acid export membrane protein